MSDSSDDMKKQEKIASRGQQRARKQEMRGMDIELNKGSETERERGSKRPPTGAR